MLVPLPITRCIHGHVKRYVLPFSLATAADQTKQQAFSHSATIQLTEAAIFRMAEESDSRLGKGTRCSGSAVTICTQTTRPTAEVDHQ